jgi:predicted  nucleic acid-binding Zn-ribbon protein
MNDNNQSNCEICYKIVCRGCGWEPSEREVLLIQQEELTICPHCGWSPGAV